MGSQAKVYTLAEVSEHNQPKDCWLVIEGKVCIPCFLICNLITSLFLVDGFVLSWDLTPLAESEKIFVYFLFEMFGFLVCFVENSDFSVLCLHWFNLDMVFTLWISNAHPRMSYTSKVSKPLILVAEI